ELCILGAYVSARPIEPLILNCGDDGARNRRVGESRDSIVARLTRGPVEDELAARNAASINQEVAAVANDGVQLLVNVNVQVASGSSAGGAGAIAFAPCHPNVARFVKRSAVTRVARDSVCIATLRPNAGNGLSGGPGNLLGRRSQFVEQGRRTSAYQPCS